MKAQQDIERQLAAAQEAWEGPPPSALWERLEERLDAQAPVQAPRKPRNWPFRIVTIAILVATGLGIWWMLEQRKVDDEKAKTLAVHAETGVDGDRGAAGAPQAAIDPATAGSQGAGLALENAADPQLAAPTVAPTAGSIPPNGLSKPAVNGTSAASPSYNGNTAATPAQGPINPYITLNQWTLNGMVVSNSFGNPIDTVSSLDQFSNLEVSQGNAYLQINPNRNRLNFNYAEPKPQEDQQNVQHLKWLLGSWKTQGNSGGTMEEWRQKDDFTLEGRGYFVVNGDTMVTEEMRIEQRGPNVYFIIAKDQNQKSTKFRLRARMPNELIFQNTDPKDANELVLRKGASANELERVMQVPASKATNDVQSADPTSDERRIRKRHPAP